MSNYEKKNSPFLTQAAILASAGLFARLIGFVYKLGMYPMLGDFGMGIYSQGYNVYGFLLVISSAGLPAAISRMVSSRLAFNQNGNAHKVFKVSVAFASFLGLFISIFMFFCAKLICRIMNIEDAYYPILTLIPTVLIVAVMSVFRGYFQGTGNMVPTALSQIAEQVINAGFSVLLVYLFYKSNIIYAAAGGTAATGIGAAAGLATVFGIYMLGKKKIYKDITVTRLYNFDESSLSIVKELIFTSFPIIMGTAVFSLANIIDSSMVSSRMEVIGTFSKGEITALYGQLSQKFAAITTLPITIATNMGMASIPGLSAAIARNDMRRAANSINLSIRLAMVICVPAAFGIGVFGDQIVYLLFPSAPEGGVLLKAGFISVIFLALSQVSTGVLQGMGKERIPAVAAACGCVVKIILNYFLISIPQINIIGAVIGTIGCYAVAAPINMLFAYRFAGSRPDYTGIFVKPIFASVVMAMFCYIIYYTVYYIFPSNFISLFTAMLAGMAVYFFIMAAIGGIKKDDCLSLPAGAKLIILFEKLGITLV